MHQFPKPLSWLKDAVEVMITTVIGKNTTIHSAMGPIQGVHVDGELARTTRRREACGKSRKIDAGNGGFQRSKINRTQLKFMTWQDRYPLSSSPFRQGLAKGA